MLRGRSQFFRRPREHSSSAARRPHAGSPPLPPTGRKQHHTPASGSRPDANVAITTATNAINHTDFNNDPVYDAPSQAASLAVPAEEPHHHRPSPPRQSQSQSYPRLALPRHQQQHHQHQQHQQHHHQHHNSNRRRPHPPYNTIYSSTDNNMNNNKNSNERRAAYLTDEHVHTGQPYAPLHPAAMAAAAPATAPAAVVAPPTGNDGQTTHTPPRDVFKWTRRRGQVFRPEGDAANHAAPPLHMRARGSSRRLSIRANGTMPAAVAGQRFYHYQRQQHHHPKALVPLRYSNADIHISGWLSKRGKRLGSRVERFLILNGSTLSNARQEGARPTWTVNIRGCKVLSGPNREIIFKVNNNFSSFYAPDDNIHRKWIDALQSVSAAVTDFYDFGKLIGTGAYSEVFLARDQMRSELCAVKVLDRIDREHARLIDSELKVLRLLNSRNLVRTYDIFDTPSQTYVVMEYLAGGELLDMITDNDHLSEPNAKHVLRQVLEAVLYLHNKGIVHRDVKPENILCVSQSFPLRVKLTDFGLSKVVSSGDGKSGDISMRSQCGTAYYLAPEVVNNVSYGKPVDMWACGVVGYVMLAGKFPFYGDTEEKFMRRLRSGVSFPNKEWRSISQNAKLLIRGLLDPNPETRLTAEQALEHRWLNDDSDILTTSSTPSSAVGDARERERLQYAAHNESLSLQLTTFAPSKARRKYVDGTPDGLAEDDDEDLVLRTEEISHKSSGPAYHSTAQSFDQAGSDDESVLPLPRVRPVHIDPPLATVRVRAAEV